MSDKITDAEREAIDAFIAEKEPTRIPTGKSSHAGFRYIEGQGLRLIDPDDNPLRSGSYSRKGGSISPKVAQRRLRLREYMAKGMGATEVARIEKISNQMVYQDAKAIGRSFERRPRNEDVSNRRKMVRELAGEGLKRAEIAARLNVSEKTIANDISRAGIKLISRKNSVSDRRRRLKDHIAQGGNAQDFADLEGIGIRSVYADARAIDMPFSEAPRALDTSSPVELEGPPPWAKEDRRTAGGRRPTKAVTDRRAKVAVLLEQGLSRKEIAEVCGVTPEIISQDFRQMGVKTRQRGTEDKTAIKRQRAAAKGAAKVADRRRFKTALVPFGSPAKTASPAAKRTIFPSRVFEPADEDVLKDGISNAKIGGDVLVGWLKGAKIYTLTLEERATCPKDCALWSACYGNSMQFARRFKHGPSLMKKIDAELTDIFQRFDRILVRLHVLGDFWSVEYAEFWGRMIDRHPGLNVFGFTAWKQGTEIGDLIAATRALHPNRFMIRHSDMTGPMGSFTLDFPTERKTIGDAIVCPEQAESMTGDRQGRHCGNCGVCWSTDRPVAFVIH